MMRVMMAAGLPLPSLGCTLHLIIPGTLHLMVLFSQQFFYVAYKIVNIISLCLCFMSSEPGTGVTCPSMTAPGTFSSWVLVQKKTRLSLRNSRKTTGLIICKQHALCFFSCMCSLIFQPFSTRVPSKPVSGSSLPFSYLKPQVFIVHRDNLLTAGLLTANGVIG